MLFLRKTWMLAKKDLFIVAWRHWLSTAIRTLIWPIVFIAILANVKNWTATPGIYGVGSPAPVKSLGDALSETGSTRPKVVIVNNGFTDGDIGSVIDQLSTTIGKSGKELHVVENATDLDLLCPSSNAGVSDCFGAVSFLGSPDHGESKQWNYTLYADNALGGLLSVVSTNNDVQVYMLPFQQAIDSAIALTHGGSGLPENIMQYPYTSVTEAKKEQQDLQEWEGLVIIFISFAFFVAHCGITYHLTGHVTHQREVGMLQLIDAMMPTKSHWESISARMLASIIAFDIIYLPGWIISGALLKIAFPQTNAGYLVLLNILGGLALASYSGLASSLFRRPQLSAISAMIAALVFALVAGFGEASYNPQASIGGVLATGILFPPAAYVYFLILTASFEINGQALQLNHYPSNAFGYNSSWRSTAATFLGCFVFQIVVFPILGVIIEKYRHGTASRARRIRTQEELDGRAVRLQGFTKHFKSKVNKKQMVKAVEELTLDLHAGSITVLLGANGSGKSTTLNAIAGLETISKGSIELDGTGGLGLCPQKNIMWDELTVEEHVDLFETLKSTRSSSRAEHRAEVNRLIEGCDLDVKRNALAKTLSGGQKRKLQLAMMFAGGSKVCCIDEASSGIDPLARRKIWDILLAERGKRSLLFTTHFLDEAEVLSDHVAILSKGELKAEGSVAALKNELGGGYRIIVDHEVDLPALPQVTQHTDYNHVVYEMPDQSVVASFIPMLEERGIHNYRLQPPTIETVFLKLADEMRESSLARELNIGEDTRHDSTTAINTAPVDRSLDLHSGRGTNFVKQTWILFKKRVTILKHNYMPYVCALFIPLVIAGLETRFFIGYNYPDGIPCIDPADSSPYVPPEYVDGFSLTSGETVFGPVSMNSTLVRVAPNRTDYYYEYYDTTPRWDTIPFVNSLDAFNDYISTNSTRVYLGGFYNDPNTPTIAWHGGQYSRASNALMVKSIADSVMMNQTINFGFQGFHASFTPPNGVTSIVAVFTALGFSIYPCLFALYPTAERLRKVRAMQYSNGIMSSSLWLAHSLFDLVFILLISVLTVVIWSTQWQGWYALGYMFVVFLLYGLAATALSYVVSLMVQSQLAAMAYTIVVQVVVSMLYFVAYIVSVTNAPATAVYTWFNYIHYTIGLISPAANLLRALFMTLNNYSLICRGNEKAAYPGEISIYGAPILYLLMQFIILVAFLIYWESGRSLEVFGIHLKRSKEPDAEKVDADFDAAEDPQRLSSNNTGIRTFNATKFFGSTCAVDNVTFGILPSEKFALLGPNGAGKSTMISLLRGELKGRGSTYIGGDSLQSQPVAAKNHLGVCPQFDAQDSMTVLEHLRFYASARGVPNQEDNIQELIRRLGLQDHAKKLAMKLSGGTQRKLSLAIALISNPSVLLLDEPSSGMDPAAKRALWKTLSAIAAGRVLLITTHSMEEADALCDRAGIMASRLLALGSIEELRARHGSAAFVHLVLANAPYTSETDMQRIRDWVRDVFPGADIEMRTFGGQLRFSVPRSETLGMGKLYRMIEEAKGDLGVADYSIGPATLDQVFLNVVGKHNVQEENTQKVKRRSWWPWR